MSGKAITNGLLFVLFFTAGIAAVSLAALVPEIGTLYVYNVTLKKVETSHKNLQKLDEQYAYQIEQIKKNPAVLARLRVLNLGEEPRDPQTAYPPASNDQLIQAARLILSEKAIPKKPEPPLIPDWLIRARNTRARIALFLTGTALIIVAMTFFSTRDDEPEPDKKPVS
jgi:hypothetical protein